MTTFSDIDMRAIEAIRGAAYFTATLAYGRGGYRVEERPTVLAAMDAAREIEQDPRAHTRRALIYAIAPDGHATLSLAKFLIGR